MVKILKNFLPKTYQDDLENTINNHQFPWYFFDNIMSDEYLKYKIKDPNITFSSGLTHVVYGETLNGINSNIFPLIKPIFYFLEEKENIILNKIMRIRIRRTFQVPNHNLNKYNHPHVDYAERNNYKSLVYYVENSDGDTFLFNECKGKTNISSIKKVTEYKRSSPIKGNAVLFDGDRFHSGNNPINYQKRTIINFDFTIK